MEISDLLGTRNRASNDDVTLKARAHHHHNCSNNKLSFVIARLAMLRVSPFVVVVAVLIIIITHSQTHTLPIISQIVCLLYAHTNQAHTIAAPLWGHILEIPSVAIAAGVLHSTDDTMYGDYVTLGDSSYGLRIKRF